MGKGILAAVLLAVLPVVSAFGYAGLAPERIVFFEETDQPKVIAMMRSGDVHLYGNAFASELYWDLIGADLHVDRSYHSFYEILLNPAVDRHDEPFFNDGRFNAFGIQKVREAMYYLIDRQYIVDTILDGLGVARWTMLDPNFPPYAQAIGTCWALETKYQHDEDKAWELICEGMDDAGAYLADEYGHEISDRSRWRCDGCKWFYDSEPVVIIGLIREEDRRLEIGNYFADILEWHGFTVERIERTSGELAPIWLLSDPTEGQWSFYTGGWISNRIDRDQGGDYAFFYTPGAWEVPLHQGFPIDLFQSADETAEEVFDRLARQDYSTIEERVSLLGRAEKWAAECAWHQWLFSAASPWATASDVRVLADVAAGISGSYIWAHTARFVGENGEPDPDGTLRVAVPSMLTTAWNPVAGSNWLYDAMIQRATEDWFVFPDPFTGLYQPHMVESAVCTVEEGIPMGATLDYVTVEYVSEISVPGDAWVDWDATVGEFITRSQKFPGGLTAKTKTQITFSDDLLSTKWHDGSTFSIGDMLLPFILAFDRAKPESSVYDSSAGDPASSSFKGARILSRDPVQIEVYHDRFYLDAEAQVFNRIGALFWPYYSQGMAPWHTIAASWLAEEEELRVWSEDKADNLGIDRQNWVAGESLNILLEKAEEAQAINFVPYQSEMLQWIGWGEIFTRYENMQAFFDTYGHLWIGNGPMMIESIDPIAKIVTGVRFDGYRHEMDKFLALEREGGRLPPRDRSLWGEDDSSTYEVRIRSAVSDTVCGSPSDPWFKTEYRYSLYNAGCPSVPCDEDATLTRVEITFCHVAPQAEVQSPPGWSGSLAPDGASVTFTADPGEGLDEGEAVSFVFSCNRCEQTQDGCLASICVVWTTSEGAEYRSKLIEVYGPC